MRMLPLLLALMPLAAMPTEVYKWVDEKGVVHYTDKPPSDNAKPAQLPPLQTYQGGTPPDLERLGGQTKGAAAAAPVQIQVVTPAPDETFRGAERTVPVAVVVTPPLGEGQRLVYYLNGTPRSEPTVDTAMPLTAVDRGTHSVSVALIDANGQELGRSSSVTFHVKPPIARR